MIWWVQTLKIYFVRNLFYGTVAYIFRFNASFWNKNMQDFFSIIKNIINSWLIYDLFYKKSEIVFALMYKVGSHNCNVLESQKSFAFPTVPLKGRRQGLCKVLFQKLFRTEFKILLFFGFLHTFWNKVEKRTQTINTSFSVVRLLKLQKFWFRN